MNKLLFFRTLLLAYAGLILWASLTSSGGTPPFPHFDKLMHLGAYGAFAFIGFFAATIRRHFFWLTVFITLYGIGMEILQSFTPNRYFSIADMIANGLGAWAIYCLLRPRIQ